MPGFFSFLFPFFGKALGQATVLLAVCATVAWGDDVVTVDFPITSPAKSLPARFAAQSTSPELLFALQSAAKSHDDFAMEECFHFEGTDPELAKSIRRTVGQIATWSTPLVFTSERTNRGPLEIIRNGKTYTLNGEWIFQIHIHRSPLPSKGFVFPAGLTPSGKYRILLTVEKKS